METIGADGARLAYYLIAIGGSLILIAALLYVRSRVRDDRQRTIDELRLLFFPDETVSIAAFDYVRAKYEMPTLAEEQAGAAPSRQKLPTIALAAAAIPYAIICAIGFIILLMPFQALVESGFGVAMVHDGLFWAMAGTPTGNSLREAAAVFAAAFLGGYLMTGRVLLRAVQNYELNQFTFLQVATHLAFGIVSGMMVYHVLRGIGLATELFDNGVQQTAFVLVAFLGGYFPDLGLTILARKLRVRLFKPANRAALDAAEALPLELIDGIDHDVRYRLEQAGITDAQILATANPILIYVETPYGLYCTFDWVLQAQLCTALGAERFQRLKHCNVRTSLDLERAVLGEAAPDAYVADLGRILFDGPGGVPLTAAAVRHGAMVMLDDLHVHRVRMLWRHIFHQIAGESGAEWIFRKNSVEP